MNSNRFFEVTPPSLEPLSLEPSEVSEGGEVLSITHSRVVEGIPRWVRRWRPSGGLGKCDRRPTCLWCIFDESGSVHTFSDPVSYRHALFARVVAEMAKSCTCGHSAAAFVTFDVARSAGPVQLRSRTTKDLTAALGSLPGTSSLLGTALAWTERALSHQDNSVVAVLSDFQLFDSDLETLYDRWVSLDARALAIVLRAEPPQGLAARGIEVVQVGADNEGTDVADALASMIATVRRGGPHA